MVRLQSLMRLVYKKIIYLVTKLLVVEKLQSKKAPHIPARYKRLQWCFPKKALCYQSLKLFCCNHIAASNRHQEGRVFYKKFSNKRAYRTTFSETMAITIVIMSRWHVWIHQIYKWILVVSLFPTTTLTTGNYENYDSRMGFRIIYQKKSRQTK